MAKRKHLIIGSGSAAFGALKRIRSTNWEDGVKLVTAEDYLPYSPTSLPYLLSGTVKETDIVTGDDSYFDEMRSTLVRGKEVTRIKPQNREVIYKDGEKDTYDTLLIATGSEPVVPAILREAGCHGYHTLSDHNRLLKELEGKSEVTILGGGLVGMELAVALAERGYQVSVVTPRERILRRYFDDEADAYIVNIFAANHVPVYKSWGEVTKAERDQNGLEISFATGKTSRSQILISCIGVTPRISFLEGSGIAVRDGVLVDSRMRTNIEDIYAAGDVAEAPDFFTGNQGLSLILPNAVLQGKVAGSNMVGVETIDEGWLPMTSFNFFGHVAISVGMSVAPDNKCQVLKDIDDEKKQYKKLIFKEGRLIGVTFLNVDIYPGVLQYLIRKRINVGQYSEHLLQKPKEIGFWLMQEAERKEALPLEA
ncbi:NAD(P)/FAD-dependent oxidoreductase [Chloroflexota bacterium]